MVEHLQAECLALGCRAQVRLEAVRVDYGYEGFHGVQWGASLWDVLSNVTATSR